MKKTKPRCGGQILYIPVDQLVSDAMRPRIYFNDEELAELVGSIAEYGILEPLTVRAAKNGKYKIVSGERRARAAVLADLKEVPCVLVRMSDEDAVFASLTENIKTSALNYFELAVSAERIHRKYCLGYDAIADKLGMSINELTEKLKMLSIPPELRTKMIENGVTERHARELIKLNDKEKELLVKEITEQRLNVSATRQRAGELLSAKKEKKQHAVTYFKDITVFVNTIDRAIDTMEKSGIKAKSSKTEEDGLIEYKVTIPK